MAVSRLEILAIVTEFERFYPAFGYVCWAQLEMGDPVLLNLFYRMFESYCSWIGFSAVDR